METLEKNGLNASLNYSRVEVATDARHRPMKLWFSTAIGS